MPLSCVLLLSLAACGDPEKITKDTGQGGPRAERVDLPALSPPARPVRIGESGPRFAACQAVGQVRSAVSEGLPVLDAPFAEAKQIASVPEDGKVFICTRSIDQDWLGIVIPNPEGGADCGISAPVRTKQDYKGPCQSGWVESPFIQLIAG